MTSAVQEYKIDKKTPRLKLAARPKPYYQTVGTGKSLGYIRRASGPGSWIVREWVNGLYATRIVGTADDIGLADGRDVLTFDQALRIATAPTLPAPLNSRLTVRAAIDQYIKVLQTRSDHGKEARQRAEKHIIPVLGSARVDRLTKKQIEDWLGGMVRADDVDPDAKRRSQDSANRVLSILKAALNHAFADDANSIKSDIAWRRVKPFRDVGGSRDDHFDATQVRKLIAKALEMDTAFANLVTAAFLTGARLGELAELDVRDFDAARALLIVRKGKTGKRLVTLTSESVSFFTRLTKGRSDAAVLLPRSDGDRWGKSEQARPFKRAAAAAGLPVTASFYTLRHSHISRAIEAGMPLSLVAENCGTSLLMIQRNYAKVLSATRRQSIEATSPKLRLVK